MLKLFDQETYSDKAAGTHGDCVRAAIRTLAQDEMPDLPHPIAEDGGWNDAFFDVLEEQYGWYYRTCFVRDGRTYDHLPPIAMAAGPTERSDPEGNPGHIVVIESARRRMIHDPHPSRAGLIEINSFHWLARGDEQCRP